MTAPSPRSAPDARVDVVGVVLAAGAGRRLAPITDVCPKALCPIGGVPLVDLAIERVTPIVGEVAVNVHHGRAQLLAHLERRGDVHVSIEEPVALGTAGAIARLRHWIGARGVLVVNADGWTDAPIDSVVDAWDGTTMRVLVHREDRLRDDSLVVASLLGADDVARLEERPSGLFETLWRAARDDGRLEVIRFDHEFIDCGTPADYLRANLTAARTSPAALHGSLVAEDAVIEPGATVVRSVVGSGAVVAGAVEESVIWAGQSVASDESLRRSIRTGESMTVVVDPSTPRRDARN